MNDIRRRPDSDEANMPQDRFTFVDAGTPDEPFKIEVRKNGRAIGRILYVAESRHVGGLYQFYPGQSSIEPIRQRSIATSSN